MWTVVKIDKKKLQLLKEDFKKYLGNSSEFYIPKMVIQKFVKNKNQDILPIGLQIICNKNEDEKAVEIALSLEKHFGEPELPNVNKFL